MKLHFFLIGTLLLSACASQPSGMMDHQMNGMQHGNGMMNGGQSGNGGFLPGQDSDVSSLPEAKPSSIIDVQDGQTISLHPTLVRKIINGKEMVMYGYNGQIPGPQIHAKQGATFTVNVTNNIDLPTSIHWHGVRVDNRNDGAVGMTQKAIEPGGSYTYTVKVPDEGIYWYHTHVREDLQQPMGLYGAIIVSPLARDAYAPVDLEQVLILNDLLVDENGAPVRYGREDADHTLMGRFGNTFLVNGETPDPLEIGLGTVARFMVVNASNTRMYRIVPPPGGALKIVGADSGRYEREYLAQSFILAPSERVIAEVYFWDDGVNSGGLGTRTVPLVVSGPPEDPVTVQSVAIVGGVIGDDRSKKFFDTRTNTDVMMSIDPFRSSFDKAPDHTLELDMNMMGGMGGMGGMMGGLPEDGIEWEESAMNAMSMGSMMQWKMIDQKTGAANKDLIYTAKVGDKVKIRIINKKDSAHPMQHPIHFHGQRFLVLSDNGAGNKNLVWKDTVLVPAGHTVDILIDISNPGDWMFHCHIAEHLENGMMGMLTVK